MLRNEYQIAVIGGGINGAGIAREAASRGYSTLLVEKKDFGHATSGQSSKLVHGGIRYLENYDFKLVREALKERRVLLETAPHLVHPLRFNIPVYKDDKRPAWMVQAGCKLYDIFAGRKNLAPSSRLSTHEMKGLSMLRQENLSAVLQYSDAQTDDSRLCLATALTAEIYGADVHNYMTARDVRAKCTHYELELQDGRSGKEHLVRCRYLVNAAGPWVPGLDKELSPQAGHPDLRYVRGIHFVVPKMFDQTGFLVMPADGRIVFVLPWKDDYTLIGTTESEFSGDEFDTIPPSDEEIGYLIDVTNQYFPSSRLTLDDVLHIYSGVRSLVSHGESNMTTMSREYSIVDDHQSLGSGYLGVFGGKLTTYRSLGEKVVDRIAGDLVPAAPRNHHTDRDPIFGAGTVPEGLAHAWTKRLQDRGVNLEHIIQWEKRHGTQWLEVARYVLEEKGFEREILPGLCRGELAYMKDVEKAVSLNDIIVRRTKLVYKATQTEKNILQSELEKL
ncbi:glycerol-3-phosphate dehydrogenase [Desulfoplanes sp. PS50]